MISFTQISGGFRMEWFQLAKLITNQTNTNKTSDKGCFIQFLSFIITIGICYGLYILFGEDFSKFSDFQKGSIIITGIIGFFVSANLGAFFD